MRTRLGNGYLGREHVGTKMVPSSRSALMLEIPGALEINHTVPREKQTTTVLSIQPTRGP